MHFHFEEWQGVEISHVKICGSIQLNFGVSDFFSRRKKITGASFVKNSERNERPAWS
jgi:hypothetical protein